LTTGPEIWKQTQGKIDYFIASGSTGGTLCGVSKFLKEKNPQVKVIMPDPIGSIYYEYFKTGKINPDGNCNYFIEGVGEDHLPKAIDFSLIDDVIPFNDSEAFEVARRLAKEEGILAGGSSGANVWAAMKLAKSLNHEAVIVTVLPDGGIKYLSKIFNDEWMMDHHFLSGEYEAVKK
jgi:cystathionine beta-synthase/cysteine synthase A